MSNAWNGANPANFIDVADYELGVKYTTSTDITITKLRIFGGTAGSFPGRVGHIWSSTGVLLATIPLPDVMTPGWALYPLSASLAVTAGTSIVVSYETVGSYGVVVAGGYPVVSADGFITANSGEFNDTPGVFPNTASGSFYGVDFEYTVGIGANQKPVVGITTRVTGFLTVAATLTVVDENPATVTTVIEWGDGTTTGGTGNLGPFTHTYSAPGTYVVLVTATDEGGLTDAAATCVTVYSSGQCGPPFTWSATNVHSVLAALLSTVSTALAATPGGVPKRTVLVPGTDIAWDACDCGQLALSVRRRYRSRVFPTDGSDTVVGNCDDVLVVFDCALSIVRCVPIPDVNGKAPSPTALDKAFLGQEEDAYVVWNVTSTVLLALRDNAPRQVADFVINDQPSLGPQGACSGSELHFKFGLYVPCGC